MKEIDHSKPYSPDNDFFRTWQKDNQGRDVLVGLSWDETKEYQNLGTTSANGAHIDNKRYLELHNKHEKTRLTRLAKEHETRTYLPNSQTEYLDN